MLVWGEDDYGVKRRAKELYTAWCAEVGGLDHETIDADVVTVGEADKALNRLHAALQTLPFFGSGKVVWFKDCSFLGDDRTSTSKVVAEGLADLAQELKRFIWDGVRLLVSAGRVDRRKTFYKTLAKVGTVETFAGLSLEDRDWMARAEVFARDGLEARSKVIGAEALAELVTAVGPNLRELANEVEKLSLYLAARPEVELQDVETLVSRHRQARAFELGDALGDRDLPRLLRALDEELWTIRTKLDRKKTVVGVLYGLIAKVRVLLLLKELLGAGLLRPTRDYSRFKAQLLKAPATSLPEDKRYNPLAMNPYVLFKALPQTANYTSSELVAAMESLLECNRRLVSTGLDNTLVLQQALVGIVG